MLKEVIEYLNPREGQNFIDCTLGGGGYTRAILERVGKNGKVLSIDLDNIAIENAKKFIKEKKINNIILANENFKDLSQIIEKYWQEEERSTGTNNSSSREESIKFDGVVFDLGLSSAQLEDKSRGFSFQLDAPLDMAFGQSEEDTEFILNNSSAEEIEKILKEYGEERFGKRIANKIVEVRKENKIKTTKQLVDIIAEAVPAVYRNNKRLHFATRSFQALRIATNKELESLREVLPQALNELKTGGHIVVISYHSLEDRIVKKFFKTESKDCLCPPELPTCRCGHKAQIKIITKKPLTATEEEIKENPRARSAKMRVVEKII